MGLFSKKNKPMVVGQLIPPPPKTFRFYRDPMRDDQSAGPGLQIEIPVNDPEFHQQTIDTLDAIYNTDTGRLVIDALVGSGKSVKIQKATLGNSCDVGPSGLNSVANELRESNIGPATKHALNRMALLRFKGNKHAWLAKEINETPYYQLAGPPPTTGNNIGITGNDVEGWFERKVAIEVGRSPEHHQHIVNSIILALESEAEDGAGSDAAIGFNANPNFVLNTERPAGIGLVHELIHAYWSTRGQQQGWTIEHRTTVLFEHKCVGLGHWDNRVAGPRICENQVRTEWFGATAGLFSGTDHVNRSAPPRRGHYSPATT